METDFFEVRKEMCIQDQFFAQAIHDIENDYKALTRLGITKQKGTVLLSQILNGEELWNKHKSQMISAWKQHEKQLQRLVECEGKGIIVKTFSNLFVCFFPEKSERLCLSIMDALSVAYAIQQELSTDNPISLGDDNLVVKVSICYGPVFKRQVHVQKKNLVDYCGDTLDVACKLLSTVDQPGIIVRSTSISDNIISNIIKGDVWSFSQMKPSAIKLCPIIQ